MLSCKTVVLVVERFCHRKENLFKEFVICTEDYLDCVSFLPPRYSEITTQQKQSPVVWAEICTVLIGAEEIISIFILHK